MATGNLFLSNSFSVRVFTGIWLNTKLSEHTCRTTGGRREEFEFPNIVRRHKYCITKLQLVYKLLTKNFTQTTVHNTFKNEKIEKLKIVVDIWKKIGLFPCFSLKQNKFKVFCIFCKLPRRMLKCEIFSHRIKRY
jgi:hypothetical protein